MHKRHSADSMTGLFGSIQRLIEAAEMADPKTQESDRFCSIYLPGNLIQVHLIGESKSL
jgi:hypothetical protein